MSPLCPPSKQQKIGNALLSQHIADKMIMKEFKPLKKNSKQIPLEMISTLFAIRIYFSSFLNTHKIVDAIIFVHIPFLVALTISYS